MTRGFRPFSVQPIVCLSTSNWSIENCLSKQTRPSNGPSGKCLFFASKSYNHHKKCFQNYSLSGEHGRTTWEWFGAELAMQSSYYRKVTGMIGSPLKYRYVFKTESIRSVRSLMITSWWIWNSSLNRIYLRQCYGQLVWLKSYGRNNSLGNLPTIKF